MKKNNNRNEMIRNTIMLILRKLVMFKSVFLINHEYMENIGTIYKGSMKESNRLLRFKERFKWKYQYAYGYAIESMRR